MFDNLTVESFKGPYSVNFSLGGAWAFLGAAPRNQQFIVDANVAKLYANQLAPFFKSRQPLIIEANEGNKDIATMAAMIGHLMERQVRRGCLLTAIGGGIIQDITCFLASNLFRGLPWQFVPTTLLAQADSCIGSKSSINVGSYKNIIGSFCPPQAIHIDLSFQATLKRDEILSGIGEMLKVHALDGGAALRGIQADYDSLAASSDHMYKYLRQSLAIKKRFIEADEFDLGIRNLLNYGHSFGHAIESATHFGVPHGVAVTMGMDMANFVAAELGVGSADYYASSHGTLAKNYEPFRACPIPVGAFLDAIKKDKKNSDAGLTLILPDRQGVIQKISIPADERFQQVCERYFKSVLVSSSLNQ